MDSYNPARRYRLWGADNVAYGPVELPTLINWIKDQRISPDTWIHCAPDNISLKASELPETKGLFQNRPRGTLADVGESRISRMLGNSMKPISFHRIKLLGGMDERQIESFISYMEIVRIKQFVQIVRNGDHGDAMFLVLEGEVRAYVMIDGRECTLSTMNPGDFFGEISLLDQGPRSADVAANFDSILLKISTVRFDQMMREAPGLATPFLLALSRAVAGRVRNMTRRYQDSIHYMGTVSPPIKQ